MGKLSFATLLSVLVLCRGGVARPGHSARRGRRLHNANSHGKGPGRAGGTESVGPAAGRRSPSELGVKYLYSTQLQRVLVGVWQAPQWRAGVSGGTDGTGDPGASGGRPGPAKREDEAGHRLVGQEQSDQDLRARFAMHVWRKLARGSCNPAANRVWQHKLTEDARILREDVAKDGSYGDD